MTLLFIDASAEILEKWPFEFEISLHYQKSAQALPHLFLDQRGYFIEADLP